MLLGASGIYIAESVGLSPAGKGLMVALPILSGSLLRIPLGVLSDRLGAKRIGVALLAFLFLPLTLGWQDGNSLPTLLGLGIMLGAAGASFAIAIPLASRWYPPKQPGLGPGHRCDLCLLAVSGFGTLFDRRDQSGEAPGFMASRTT